MRSFTPRTRLATVSALTALGAFASLGTATAADPALNGEWAPFTRCPVDAPAMLAADGFERPRSAWCPPPRAAPSSWATPPSSPGGPVSSRPRRTAVGADWVPRPTVRYRLRTLDAYLGDRLADPDHRFALEVALRSRHLRSRDGAT
ncbi:hypothetical protein SALBM217S_01688 [Streptomyces griseoloalbus]